MGYRPRLVRSRSQRIGNADHIGGLVDLLVVLYSINVFLTFTLSLAGLCIYWIRQRKKDRRWRGRLGPLTCGRKSSGSRTPT